MASAEEELAKAIAKVYGQAAEEVKKKIEKFWARHKEKAARLKRQVKDGKISEDFYQNWLRGQVFIGERWAESLDDITKTYVKADEVARKIVGGTMKNEFVEFGNLTAYDMEKDFGGSISFDLYDAKTIERLLQEDPMMLPEWKIDQPKDYAWNEKRVKNAIAQGILQGESIPEIGKRLTLELATSNAKKMEMFARTAVTGAQNAGRIERLHDAQAMGIEVKKKWLATLDSRTRDAHQDLDGQEVEIDEPFKSELGDIQYPGDPMAKPANIYNCFVGETNVATDSDIIRSYKHDYSGELITVKTACGVEFTCTPNHPILTPSGWIAAKSLNNGDDLMVASIGEVYALGVDPNVNHTLSRIDAIHEFIDELGGQRTSSLSVNFHGDVPTSDVEIITQKWLLRDNGNTSRADCVDKLLLEQSNEPFVGKGAFMQHLGRVWFATFRLVRGFNKAFAFLRRGLAHAIIHGFRPITRCNATVFKPQVDSVTGDAQFLRDGLDGLPGKIFVDNIVSVNITTVSHIPVYNLQTGNGRYFVNSIITQNGGKRNGNFAIAHNCRCTLTYIYPKFQQFQKPTSITKEDGTETSGKNL